MGVHTRRRWRVISDGMSAVGIKLLRVKAKKKILVLFIFTVLDKMNVSNFNFVYF